VPKYKHLAVKTVALADIAPQKAKPKIETPRQRATRERDEEIVATFNEAAALPSSEAVAIELRGDQKLPTMRAAINRLLVAEGRDLSYGVRGTTIYISKGNIPGGRGRKRVSYPRSRAVEALASAPKD
jgi:hypothetical protein